MKCHFPAWVVIIVVPVYNLVNGDYESKVRETKTKALFHASSSVNGDYKSKVRETKTKALFHATSSRFLSTWSALYTPGLHALTPIILRGILFNVATLPPAATSATMSPPAANDATLPPAAVLPPALPPRLYFPQQSRDVSCACFYMVNYVWGGES
jgi:hypothetical protein